MAVSEGRDADADDGVPERIQAGLVVAHEEDPVEPGAVRGAELAERSEHLLRRAGPVALLAVSDIDSVDAESGEWPARRRRAAEERAAVLCALHEDIHHELGKPRRSLHDLLNVAPSEEGGLAATRLAMPLESVECLERLRVWP